MKSFIVIVLFILSGCVHNDEWTKRDTKMQIAATVAIFADGYTTSNIHKTEGLGEGGRARLWIGDQPSTTDTILYFGASAAVAYFVTRALPAKWRPYFQTFVIIDEMNYAIQNYKREGRHNNE